MDKDGIHFGFSMTPVFAYIILNFRHMGEI